ncbi:unnamed protein product [Onchocerca flexuosa]|uniref:Uncharacterized protein n=1 Tax=Onchocerca flexuosa TaxID=387005 RepID=A0A183HI39_9BILA|nr:unnamed protein product [Onchocerca flexuosa]
MKSLKKCRRAGGRSAFGETDDDHRYPIQPNRWNGEKKEQESTKIIIIVYYHNTNPEDQNFIPEDQNFIKNYGLTTSTTESTTETNFCEFKFQNNKCD